LWGVGLNWEEGEKPTIPLWHFLTQWMNPSRLSICSATYPMAQSLSALTL
jgi:hypothetical protein